MPSLRHSSAILISPRKPSITIRTFSTEEFFIRDIRLSSLIFDEALYKKRFVVERINAWVDSFNAILVRFESKK